MHGHAAAAQIVREHARRRDAVDVVVAEDGHVLPPLDGGADARDGLVHVLQEHGVEHALVAAAEKGARLPGVVIAAQRQQHRQQRGIARAQQRLRRLPARYMEFSSYGISYALCASNPKRSIIIIQ